MAENLEKINIVQVGANRGNDDLTPIVFQNKDRLGTVIFVEPLSVHHDALKECYSGIPVLIEGVVIADDPAIKEMSFFYTEKDAPNYEISSISKEHLLTHSVKTEEIIEEKIKCITLNALLKKHNLSTVELLFIDAEGFDEAIIRSIDFRKFDIRTIIYENLHVRSNDQLSNFLMLKNYKIQVNWGLNGWSNRAIKQTNNFKFFFVTPFLFAQLLWRDHQKSILQIAKSALFKIGLFKTFNLSRYI